MAVVQIADGVVLVDDTRVPLFAGEVHYWRLNPARWPAVLDRVRELGLGIVGTYVPWEYHELARGQFDFRGETEPQRDLVGFLELLAAREFWVIMRPGPYIYAEWRNAGVPDRVVGLPRIGAVYRREAEVWMRAVTDVLRPYLATCGGRIILFQPDNEMDLFSHWFEDEAGLSGAGAGFFQEFLRSIYPDVTALNMAWGTTYKSLDQAQGLAERPNGFDSHVLRRHQDYWRFQHWATAEGVRWHAEMYRQLGVDVPLVANYYPGGDVQNWREVARAVDLVGIDWYPRNEFGGALPSQSDGSSMTGGGGAMGQRSEHRRFLDTCRYQTAVSPLPFVAEFECGVWHGYHDYTGALTPNHYRLMAVSALLAGIRGWNWYMFVARDNWYYSPVNERGELRPELAEVFLSIHRVVHECDPTTLRKLTQTAVFIDPLQIATDRVLAANPLLDALYLADLDYDMVDSARLARMRAGEVEARRIVFYAGKDWLGRVEQAHLAEFMDAGGTLVVFQETYPQRDENFLPHNGLGVQPADRILSRLGKKVAVELGTERPIAEGAVWNWDRPPGDPIWCTQAAGTQQVIENADKWMTRYIGKRWICGYRQPRGRGALVVLGLPPNPGLMRSIHRWRQVPLFAQAELTGVLTAVFERAAECYLFVANTHDTDVRTRVELEGVSLAGRVRVTDLWTGHSEALESGGISVYVPRRSGGVWRIGK